MAVFVIQAHPNKEQSFIDGLALLGGIITRRLNNLSLLANSFICTVDVNASPQELGDIDGVEVVEGEFYHPFYDVSGEPTGPRFFGGRLPNMPLLPNHLFAAALQMLPPALYEDLPTADALSNLLNLSMMDAGALEPFSTEEHPLGAPGLSLGNMMTLKEVVNRVGGIHPSAVTSQDELAGTALADIISTVRLTEAQKYNQGEGAVVAIIDSGVGAQWVPQENRIASFSDDEGSDPWIDHQGHGSMVAGIIMAGAPNTNIISCKPRVSANGNMSSLGTLACFDFLVGWAQENNVPVICNASWGIFGVKNLILPCSVVITRTVRLMAEKKLVQVVWAAGNNRHIAGDSTISGYCMNTTNWSVSSGALTQDLSPQYYSSIGGQCFPFSPTVSAPTYGILPWKNGWMDFGAQGGGTSACAPLVSAALAIMMTEHPGLEFREYRTALRQSASNAALGMPLLPYHPATGTGLLQADKAVSVVPSAKSSPWYYVEATTSSSVPALGSEPDVLAGRTIIEEWPEQYVPL